VQIIPLVMVTALLVLGFVGTIGKLLFDDWRLRQMMRVPARPLPETPLKPPGNIP